MPEWQLYTVNALARDGTVLTSYGNQYWSEVMRWVTMLNERAKDIRDPLGPRAETPIAKIVIEIQDR